MKGNPDMNVVITVLCVLLIIVLLAFLFWIIAIAPRTKNRPSFRKLARFDYAHRGLHDDKIPENSLPAFEAAAENGYGMEYDLQLTKDDKVVIHHDNSLKRICGVDKLISDLTLEELGEIRLAGTEYGVPLFSDVLKAVNGRTPMIIEYKGYGDVERLCTKAWEILKDYKGDYCIESFHPMIVKWFKENHPEIIRGQLMMHFTGKENEFHSPLKAFFARNLFTNLITRPDFEAYDHHSRDNKSLRLCRKLYGIQEVSWTIRTPEDHKKVKDDGCLSIFENFRP